MLPLATGDAARTLQAGRDAQRLGYDGVFSFDHLHAPGDPARPSLESFTVLAAIAAVCPELVVGTLVARAGLRPVGILAKMAAQLDDLSGGKAIIGLGAGDPGSHDELVRFGISDPLTQGERRTLLGETASAVRALLHGEAWQGGEVTPPLDGPLLPPPVRTGGPPVWLGGISDAVVALAARVADGWNGWGLGVEAFGAKGQVLARAAAEAGNQCEATWGGICVIATDEHDLKRRLQERRERDRSFKGVWTGTMSTFAAFASELEGAGSKWLIVASGSEGSTEAAPLSLGR